MRSIRLLMCLNIAAAFIFGLCLPLEKSYAAKCPCDIYKDGGTPCVAAHSTVRALYQSYNGPLYQIRLKSDTTKKTNIYPVSAGGYANTAAVDSFLKGTTGGTISIIYDQSEKKNDLTVSLYGSAKTSPLTETPPTRLKDTLSRHTVYPLATNAGEGYRKNITNGVATGKQAEGMYMVCSGKRYNSGCCFDYGNAESDASATGKSTGSMEALYFGSSCWFSPCQGTGPWFFADLEWGLFQASTNGTTNLSLPYKYVSGFLKGDSATYTIRANDATLDALKLMGTSNRPSAWVTNKLTGAIILAIGGDSSPSGYGTFYEGAMTIGRPADTTENAVQKNISLVYSGKDTITTGVYRAAETSPALQIKTHYNLSKRDMVISYVLPDAQRVSITIIDQCGRRIATIANGVRHAGMNEARWDSGRTPAGIYIWRIVTEGRESGAGKIIVGR